MKTRTPFQYSLLRYVHDIATGEFLNIGVAVYSPEAHYFNAKINPNYGRITGAFPGADGEFYRSYAGRLQTAFNQLAEQINQPQHDMVRSDRIDKLITAVLPKDDSAFQFSEVMTGAGREPAESLEHLYQSLVLKYSDKKKVETRSRDDVWRLFRKPLVDLDLLREDTKHEIETPYDKFVFEHAVKNGKWHLFEPTSFDVVQPDTIRDKAHQLNTKAELLADASDNHILYVLAGKPRQHDQTLQTAYHNARRLLTLRTAKYRLEFIEEDQAEDFAHTLARQFNHP